MSYDPEESDSKTTFNANSPRKTLKVGPGPPCDSHAPMWDQRLVSPNPKSGDRWSDVGWAWAHLQIPPRPPHPSTPVVRSPRTTTSPSPDRRWTMWDERASTDHRPAQIHPGVEEREDHHGSRSGNGNGNWKGRRRCVLSSPAFWAAPGVPASHGQRGHKREAGRSVTTLIPRAAASF